MKNSLSVLPARRVRLVTAVLLAIAAALVVAAVAAVPAAAEDIKLPALIDRTTTLAEQFGYAPSYPRNVPGFDSSGAAYIRSRTAAEDDTAYVATQWQGAWERRDLLQTLQTLYPDFAGTVGAGGYFSARVVFDLQDRAYTVLTIRNDEGEFRNLLLYSLDSCRTWQATELPFGDEQACFDGKNVGNVACEFFTGHNPIDGPPFIAVWRTAGTWPGSWADRNELYVVQPYFDAGRLVVPRPVFVTDRFLGMLQCAGDSSFAATRGDKTFFTYAQVVAKGRGGSPTYVAVYDRKVAAVVARHRVARALPMNDVHTTPGICIDSAGYLHVVIGSHAQPFKYSRSLLPNDISAWTRAESVLTSGWIDSWTDRDGAGKQTYASLVCDRSDVLRLVFRQTRRGIDSWLDRTNCHALCIQSRPPNGVWSSPRILAVGKTEAGYVNFYQHLAISPSGRLLLAFSYYTHRLPVPMRMYSRFPRRMVWASDDGWSWRFATDADLAPAMPPVLP